MVACIYNDPTARVYLVVDVGVEQRVPPVTATYCEVYRTCEPHRHQNLDHEWSWVGVWAVLTVLVVVVLLSRRPSRK